MQDALYVPNTDHGGVSHRAIGPFSSEDMRHGSSIVATSHSCSLNVATASAKLPGMRRNHAEIPLMENTGKQAVFVETRSEIVDRRVSVAPMMDWTDDL